jgi:hypothetical protein
MKVLRALMLVLALSVSASAGWMDNGRAGNMPCEKTGDMPNEKTGIMPNEKTTPVDPVTEIALQVLQSMLPLF